MDAPLEYILSYIDSYANTYLFVDDTLICITSGSTIFIFTTSNVSEITRGRHITKNRNGLYEKGYQVDINWLVAKLHTLVDVAQEQLYVPGPVLSYNDCWTMLDDRKK